MKLTDENKMRFTDYLAAAAQSRDDLAFFFDNHPFDISLDGSPACFHALESLFRQFVDGTQVISAGFGDAQDFAELISRYLGQTIVARLNGRWIQSTDNNHMFGQPCVDGFGNQSWDRIYPVALANAIVAGDSPSLLGMRDQRVLAAFLEKSERIAASSGH